ncbi:MAG TPA: WD40 repeat domain-containing protein, partial [Abditibacteriaceae bacterium]
GATGIMSTLEADGAEREIWRRAFDWVPVEVIIAGRTQPYVAAFDAWGRPGAQHSLTLIGPTGQTVRDFTLEELLTSGDIATRVVGTDCCRWWREGAEATILGRDYPTLRIDFPWGKTVIVDMVAGRTPLLNEIREAVPLQALALSADGVVLASGGEAPPLKLWNTATNQLNLTLDAPAAAPDLLSFAPNANLLATVQEGTVMLWDVMTGTARPFTIKPLHPVSSLAFSPDGALLATGLAPGRFRVGDGLVEGQVKLWDVQSGAPRLTLRWQDNEPPRNANLNPSDMTIPVAFSPDGTTIAGGTWRGVALWDKTTGDLKHTLPAPSPVTTIAYSRDNRWLAAGRRDGSVQIHEVANGNIVSTLTGFNGQGALSFTPDSRYLAGTGLYNEIRLWDTRTWRINYALRGHTSFVTSLAFAPDSMALYSSSEDGTIKIWKVD